MSELYNPFYFCGIPDDAVPYRPWWRLKIVRQDRKHTGVDWYTERIEYEIIRKDGAFFQNYCNLDWWRRDSFPWERFLPDLFDMDRIDRETPLDVPPLLPGQTWAGVIDPIRTHAYAEPHDFLFWLSQDKTSKKGAIQNEQSVKERVLVSGPRSAWAHPEWVQKHGACLERLVR